jgi:DNA-binding MarR family transcriptional regulator
VNRTGTPIRVGPDFAGRYPGASAIATECAMNLVRTGDLVVERVAGLLQPFQITPASGLVLSILEDAGGPLPPNAISKQLIVSRAAVTGLLDSLEKRGYVRRTAHPTDRRMLLVEITESGSAAVREFRPLVHREQAKWLACLTPEEQETLVHLLGRIQQQLSVAPESS